MQADKADIVYHSYTAVLCIHTHILDDAAHMLYLKSWEDIINEIIQENA